MNLSKKHAFIIGTIVVVGFVFGGYIYLSWENKNQIPSESRIDAFNQKVNDLVVPAISLEENPDGSVIGGYSDHNLNVENTLKIDKSLLSFDFEYTNNTDSKILIPYRTINGTTELEPTGTPTAPFFTCSGSTLNLSMINLDPNAKYFPIDPANTAFMSLGTDINTPQSYAHLRSLEEIKKEYPGADEGKIKRIQTEEYISSGNHEKVTQAKFNQKTLKTKFQLKLPLVPSKYRDVLSLENKCAGSDFKEVYLHGYYLTFTPTENISNYFIPNPEKLNLVYTGKPFGPDVQARYFKFKLSQ